MNYLRVDRVKEKRSRLLPERIKNYEFLDWYLLASVVGKLGLGLGQQRGGGEQGEGD